MYRKSLNMEWTKYYDFKNDDPVVALILAIQYRDWKSIQALVLLQENINARDSEGDWTPLMYAALEESLDTVKILVEAGADPNLRGTFEPDCEFPLNIAALSCNQYVFNSYAYARNKAIFNF